MFENLDPKLLEQIEKRKRANEATPKDPRTPEEIERDIKKSITPLTPEEQARQNAIEQAEKNRRVQHSP